jgi:hypothetical protein
MRGLLGLLIHQSFVTANQAMSLNVETAQSEIAAGSPFHGRVRPICKLCFGQYVWFASTRFQVVDADLA